MKAKTNFAILWNNGETELVDTISKDNLEKLGRFVTSYTSMLNKFTQVYVNGCVIFENK